MAAHGVRLRWRIRRVRAVLGHGTRLAAVLGHGPLDWDIDNWQVTSVELDHGTLAGLEALIGGWDRDVYRMAAHGV